MTDMHKRPRTGGGPAQQAGNVFHHLYAATRVLELLDPDTWGVRAVYLEGLDTGSAEEDAVDVAVDRHEALELIQVRWSQRPRRLQPGEWWEAIGRLWRFSRAVPLQGQALELKVRTNRSASPALRRQKEIWEDWAQLDDSGLAGRLDAARQASAGDERRLWETVSQAVESDDADAIAAVLRSLRLEAGLGDAALDDTQRLLDALLRAQYLPPERWRRPIVQRVAERCTPQWAGKPITAEDVAGWLGLPGRPGMAHDIALPEAYVRFPMFGEQVDAGVSRLARSGGVLVLIGSPGSGKTVQLAEWARDRRYPFYACRVDNRDDDIRQRAGQPQFLIDIARGIRDQFPDRLPQRPGITATMAAAVSEREPSTELVRILNALSANSSEDSPAVIVVDGVDDARRALESSSFLEIIQRPPPHVVLVISTQGAHFLPGWLRRPSERVNHFSMPVLPDEMAVEIVRRLLGIAETAEPQVSTKSAPEPHSNGDLVERVVRLSAGNVLVLRTICGQLGEVEPERRLAVLGDLGEQAFDGIQDYFGRLLASPSAVTRSLLRALALVRGSLSLRQVADATGRATEDLDAERQNIGFVLAVSDSTPLRYRLYHPSLRRFVCEHFFPDGEADMHGKLADMAAIAPQRDPLAAELPYHLARAERWAEVVGAINYDFLDRLFDTFSAPSQIREQVDLLAQAAARVLSLSEAVRAMLVAQKVERRLDYFLSSGGLPYSEDNADFSTLMRVLLAGGQRLAATNLLREMGEPEAKFRIACVLAEEAFEDRRDADAQALLEIARTTALFHAPGRDIVAASARAACRAWSGAPLDELLRELVSSQWRKPRMHGEPAQMLSDEEQVNPRCETVHRVGKAAARAGQLESLPEKQESIGRRSGRGG